MNYFAIALLTLFITLLAFPFVNRICNCFECCAVAKALGNTGEKEKLEKLANEIYKNC